MKSTEISTLKKEVEKLTAEVKESAAGKNKKPKETDAPDVPENPVPED